MIVMRFAIWYHFYNLEWRSVFLQPATLLKVTLLQRCFLRFLNCTNSTKSHNASHIMMSIRRSFELTRITDQANNWNVVLFKESYHIKGKCLILNNDVKASGKMQLFRLPFNYNVYTHHDLTVSFYSNGFRLQFHLYNLFNSVFLNRKFIYVLTIIQ